MEITLNYIAFIFSFLWFCLPGFLFGIVVLDSEEYEFAEWIPISFLFSCGLLSPVAAYALFFHYTIDLVYSGFFILTALFAVCFFIKLWRNQWQWPRFRRDATNYWLLGVAALITLGICYLTYNGRTGGDTWTYGGYVNEYMSGLPMNAFETFFGTDLPVVPRRAFYVWGVFMAFIGKTALIVEPLNILKGEFVPIMSVLVTLSFYTLARHLFVSRNKALIAVTIQLLFLLSSGQEGPTEIGRALMSRSTEDKMVMWMVTLPTALVFGMSFLRSGGFSRWLTAIVSACALAFMHPLGMPFFAITATSYSGFYFLFNGEHSWGRKFWHCTCLLIVTLVFLSVPLVQRQAYADDPRNATYDLYEENEDGEIVADRRVGWERVIAITEKIYVSNPDFLKYPLIILAIILLPFLFYDIRRDPATHYLLSNMLIALLLLYPLASIVGRLITPWQVWRITWLMPAGLIVAFFAIKLIEKCHGLIEDWRDELQIRFPYVEIQDRLERMKMTPIMGLRTEGELELINYMSGDPRFENGDVALTETEIARIFPTYLANFNLVEFRGHPVHGGWMMNLAPPDRADEFLQRARDGNNFFESELLTPDLMDILYKYDTRYLILAVDHPLILQIFSMPQMFKMLYSNQEYAVYEIDLEAGQSSAIVGNQYLQEQQLSDAEYYYQDALDTEPADTLASLGLANYYGNLYAVRSRKADLQKSNQFFQSTLRQRLSDPESRDQIFKLHLYDTLKDKKLRSSLLNALVNEYGNADEILALDLTIPDVYADLIETFKTQKRSDEAIRIAREGIMRWPDDAELNSLLAQIYIDSDQPQKAVAQYQSTLDKYPEMARLRVELGRLYLQLEEAQ